MYNKEKKEIILGIVMFVLISFVSFDRLYYFHNKGDLVVKNEKEIIQSTFFENGPKSNPFSVPDSDFFVLPSINFIKPKIENTVATAQIQKPVANPIVLGTTTKKEIEVTTNTIKAIKILLPPESPVDYKDNNNSTIIDNYTNLMWSKCTSGMTGKDCSSGSPIMKEWSKARNECDVLKLANKTGWRLPTLKELQSIVDTGSFNPTINKNYFPNTTSNPYWTSTSPAQYPASKFTVLFSDGSVYYKDGGNIATVRCVRDNI